MLEKRVVISGVGVITPIGIGRKDYWNSLQLGKSGIARITRFDSSYLPCKIAGEINNFDPLAFLPAKLLKRTDRSTHLALAAMVLALQDSNLSINEEIQKKAHVILGTAMSGHVSYITELKVYMQHGYKKVSPFASVSCFPDACSGQLSIFFKLKGPTETICAGCAASVNSVLEAFRRIKRDEATLVFAGGTDAPIAEEIFSGFCQSKILSQRENDAPAPFDALRDGTVLSEGAGILVVEELQSALKRNAPIYAEIIGGASTSDAYHMAGSDPLGTERIRAVNAALQEAKVQPEEVSYISAHGTGTVLNDESETEVIKKVFGEHAYKIPISSIKSMIGHCQGAAGVLEIAATLLAFSADIIPPTINYKHFDSKCDLNYVPNIALNKRINIAVKNAFAFGGKNSIIVLKKVGKNGTD